MKVLKIIGITITVLFALIGVIFTSVFIGMRFGLFNVRGSISERNKFFTQETAIPTTITDTSTCVTGNEPTCGWNNSSEWKVVASGLTKDESTIERVSTETGVPTRMIAAIVVPEQMRFFTSNRESFKKYFEPLKVLGSLTQFSLGVSGIKEDTARAIENHATNPASPFYPGENMNKLIVYPDGSVPATELYNRLTNAQDHYYQYLYTALFIKEVEAQWGNAGFDIHTKPEIIATLFNLGFQASHPKSEPLTAGSIITVGGKNYSYGELGALFYYSNEADFLKRSL